MIKIGKAKRSVMAVSILAFSVQSAFAYTVNVNSSIPISTQVMPALSTANGLLGNIQATLINIGTAISQQGDRQAALMQQVAETNRQFEVEQKRNDRLLQAQDKYRVPDDICAQSIGGGAAGVSSAAAGGQRTLGSASSAKDVKAIFEVPARATDVDASSTAEVHSQYCDSSDYAAFGGTSFCPSVSDMPRADTSLSSLLYGAGKEGKAPDLTFTDEQTDAALRYMKNTALRSAGRQLSRGEQYRALTDAAAQPQMEMIANSKPNPATDAALADARKVPEVESYFQATASNRAKQLNRMSAREFEEFEVGRRYSNPAYQATLTNKNTEDLMREQINIANLNNWLVLKTKQQLEKQNVLLGQILANDAYQTYKPMLAAQLESVNAGVSRK
ncbi:conjugal transfer protein TraW [Klebsiella pneumoniae]